MGQNKPLIGLVCGHQQQDPDRYYVNSAYIRAVIESGGTPREQLFDIVELLDGLVLPGGVDIDPNRFGENPHPKCGEIDPIWDDLDLMVTGLALERDIPILAICRGCQVLNVALGGTLVQDISSQISEPIKHTQEAPRWYATHDIVIQPSSILGKIWGTVPQRVNSFHHQSVRQVGRGLRITATAPDGVVEAIESTQHRFVLGVQWHPELMFERYPAAQELFRSFIQSAAHKNIRT